MGGRTVLLGGLGGDSHSVGIHILRRALQADGYEVRFLGTQNALPAFFAAEDGADAVLVSCMDGHARHYLRDFQRLREGHGHGGPRFYLGGNPVLRGDDDATRHFLELGFTRVFTSFVDVTTLLEMLASDLGGRPRAAAACRRPPPPVVDDTVIDLSERPRGWKDFEQERDEVTAQWPTGSAARSLEDNAEFLRRRPSFARVQSEVANGHALPLLQPRSGVPTLREQIDLFTTFESSGARVLSYQVDSLTRNNDYEGVEHALAQPGNGSAVLNGFPVVNQGVPALRRIAEAVNVPLQTRHSTRDPRLLAEISYAGGVTAFEGGAITYNIPYYKDYPLQESISRWQYVDRLTAVYADRLDVVLDREFFGTLTATLVPPCIAIVIDLLEAHLAIAQGVRCVSLGYAEQGNRVQDVAAMRTMRSLASELFPGTQVNTVFHQYMAAFPPDRALAANLIYESAVTGKLAGATRIMLKTAVEAVAIPSAQDNAEALAIATRGLADARPHQLDEHAVAAESRLIRREVDTLFRAVVDAGEGDVARGVVRAFARGILDVPFSPSVYNRGEVATARDLDGAVRFLHLGQTPFSPEIREFHAHKMNERLAANRLSWDDGHRLIESDVLCVPRGRHGSWPLDTAAVSGAVRQDTILGPRPSSDHQRTVSEYR